MLQPFRNVSKICREQNDQFFERTTYRLIKIKKTLSQFYHKYFC